MTPQKLVDEDASQLETKEFRQMMERQEGMLRDKDTIVADIKDGYDRAGRRGIDKPAYKDSIKWRKIGGLAAFQVHVAKVIRYLTAMGEEAQLDIFAQALTAPVFMPKTAEEKAAEAGEEEVEDGIADEGEDTMRQVGEIAETVVETVREMVEQNSAAVEAGLDEPTPDQQAEAKLEGEAAGRKGFDVGLNPYPIKDRRHTWWLKGFNPAHQEWQTKNPNVASINGGPVRRGKGPQPGFVDRSERMSAAQAAKLLGAQPEA